MKKFLWASYGMYFLGGITTVFFGAIMPELLSYYHTTYTMGGILVFLQSIGFIIGVPLASYCMKKMHYRYILSSAAMFIVIGQLGILCLPNLFLLGLFIILNGIGVSALETAVASYVMELFVGRRAIFMSRLEVAFGLGALVMPIISSGLIAIHWWRFSSILVGGFALLLVFMWQSISVSLEAAEQEGHSDASTAEAPIFKRNLHKYSILFLFLLSILVYVGVEGSLNSFLPSLFMVSSKASPYIASLSTSVFWVAMLCGRLAIGWIVRRVSYERYLLSSMIIGCICILLLTQSKILGVSYLILFGLGLGFSAIYSITMVYANHTFPGMERTVTSAVTAFAGIGGALLPFIIGYVMDHYPPNQVVWLIFIFNLLLLFLFLVIYGSLRIIRSSKNARITHEL